MKQKIGYFIRPKVQTQSSKMYFKEGRGTKKNDSFSSHLAILVMLERYSLTFMFFRHD